jgi:competence protein ComEA
VTLNRLQISIIGLSVLGFLSGLFCILIADHSPASLPDQQNPKMVQSVPEYIPIEKQAPEFIETVNTSKLTGGIDINNAGPDELQRLPRVGQKTAQLIIAYRQTHGPFKTVDELTAIKGIGPKSIAGYKTLAFCGTASPDATPPGNPTRIPTLKPSEIPDKDRNLRDSLLDIDMKMDLNTASREDLISLPRIGPVTAQKIIDYRNDHGPFQTLDTLANVKGIGPKTLQKLRPYLSVQNLVPDPDTGEQK